MFSVIVSDRLEWLAAALADRLAANPPRDPLSPEVIVVQNRGIERWLAMHLADRFGIWSAARFPFPHAFLMSIAALLGLAPADGPTSFSRGALTWALFDLLRRPDAVPESVLPPEANERRRASLAATIAALFDEYQAYRPDWLVAWGDRTSSPPPPTGPDAAWQADLWRRAVARLAVRHRAQIWLDLIQDLQRRPTLPPGAPPRISVFGLSSLPPLHLAAFAALGRHIDVTFYAFNPCREMWFETPSPRASARRRAREVSAGLEPGALHVEDAPSLLAANGMIGRDFLASLYEHAHWQVEERWSDAANALAGALDILRQRILEYQPEPSAADPRLPWPDGDRSLRVHVCHSPRREIEVLRDRVLEALNADPTMTPRDVLVMAPDIEIYAPHIEAVFGGELPPIPYAIADRSPLRIGHIADAIGRWLRLPDGEFTASELFDLLCLPPVRRAFHLPEESLETVRAWLAEASIRRGVGWTDGLPAPATWAFGLERLAMGNAVRIPPLERIAGVLPVEIDDPSLLAALWNFIAAAADVRRDLNGPHPPDTWAQRLTAVLDRCLTPAPEELAELAAVRAAIEQWRRDAARAGCTQPLGLAAARAMISTTLAEPALAAPFLRGGVTFCNLMPMRNVPFRFVHLLGMNDEAFPRSDAAPSFSLLRAAPRRGDRTRRADDRYVFLECLFAARDVLSISCVGRNARTDQPSPPSVCVSELLDVLDRTFDTGDGCPARRRVIVEHPLQPFSARYYPAHPDAEMFSFSGRHRAGVSALANRSPETDPPPVLQIRLDAPLDRTGTDPQDLARFFRDPVSEFLRRRLDVRTDWIDDDIEDAEPLLPGDEKLVALASDWMRESDDALGSRPMPLRDVLEAAGRLPPGAAGDAAMAALGHDIERLLSDLRPRLSAEPVPAIVWSLDRAGVHFEARLGDVRPCGLVRWKLGSWREADRLLPWIEHLVLCAARPPGVDLHTAVVATDASFEWGPVDRAEERLTEWLDAYAEGLRRALPIWPACAWAWIRADNPRTAADRVRAAWQEDDIPGVRQRSPLLSALFPDTYDPVADEFIRLCERLYRPIDDARLRRRASADAGV